MSSLNEKKKLYYDYKQKFPMFTEKTLKSVVLADLSPHVLKRIFIAINYSEARKFIMGTVNITGLELDEIMRWCFENTVREKLGIKDVKWFREYIKKINEKTSEKFKKELTELNEKLEEECDCKKCKATTNKIKEMIEMIKCTKLKKRIDQEDCPICLTELDRSSEIVVPCCGVSFCKKCLSNSLRERETCPTCRADTCIKSF